MPNGMEPRSLVARHAIADVFEARRHSDASVSSSFDCASANLSRSIQELFEILRIPSVSALPEHSLDVRAAAEASAAALRNVGMERVHLAECDGGNPVVRGD